MTPEGPDSSFSYSLSRKLDAFTSLQTAPYNSFKNPVELKMSLLNFVWQGIGIMRNEITNFEQKLKNCNGLNAIRSLADKFPELKQEFLDSVESSKCLLIEMVYRIHTSAGDVFSFDSDINYELGQLENELKKIQPDFKMDEMIQKKKVCLSDFPRIQNAITLRSWTLHVLL